MLTCGATLAAGILLETLNSDPLVSQALYTICYLSGGYFGLRESLASLRKGEVDVDLLMVLAALGAAYVGAPFEGGMLLFLFSLSNVLQNHALDRSRQAIQALMQLRPTEVLCKVGERFERVAVDSVKIGTIARLKPGERIALDGEVTEGHGSVDESSLTGEALPVYKESGSKLFAGTINQTGSLLYRVTSPSSESTLTRIIAMVEHAQARKAKTERFLEKAERYYAVAIILFTLGLIIIPPTLAGADLSSSFYRAMTVMVVASPCALVISTPAAFLSAIAGAARQGILFKGGVHLERLAAVDIVAFDKTGTLTSGKPTLQSAVAFPLGIHGEADQEKRKLKLIQIAASLENHSEHPIAGAIQEAALKAGLESLDIQNFEAILGKGARATVAGMDCFIGSPSLFKELGGTLQVAEEALVAEALSHGETTLLLAQSKPDGTFKTALGMLTVADNIREDTADAIERLKTIGVERIVMLTGDAHQVAETTARLLGIDEVRSELLPQDKLRIIQELNEQGKVAMVGDGVNDAPALAAAHVGIAMGAAGTDVAMETADVVLLSNRLNRLAAALNLARRSRAIVAQNLSFALLVIVILVSFSLSIGIPLPLGVVGHEGSTVLVCLNGLRLLAIKNRSN
ncbi:heavy metal translocating P-type ATPase [Pelagicoccus albus]